MIQIPERDDVVRRYYNRASRVSMSIRAHIEAWIMGRASGKTRSVIAPRLVHNALAMERSLGGYIVPSLKMFKRQLAQSLTAGIQDRGLKSGTDFVIGKPPSAKWPRPHNQILDHEFSMSWRNGSAVSFLGQHGSDTGVGGNFDYSTVEEARLIEYDRLEHEYLPAVRGNLHHFGGMAEHYSLLIATDRPATKKGRWVFRYQDLVNDDVNGWILSLNAKQMGLEMAIASGSLSTSTTTSYRSRANSMGRMLNELRRDAVFYGYGNVVDNVYNLGIDWILEREATLSDRSFRITYLNEDLDQVAGAFYAGFDEARHGYWPQVNPILHSIPVGHAVTDSSLLDQEIDRDRPLELGMDYGANINCMVVGQRYEDKLRIDRSLHCLHPQITVDVVRMFVDHYASHRNKRINFYIDNTARGRGGQSQFSYEQIVVNTLRAAGWDVNVVYIGIQPAPELRYQMWSRLFSMRTPFVTINLEGADDLVTSMRLCEVQEGRNGAVRKNKSGEGKGSIDDEVLLPHYTDALDTLIWGVMMLNDEGQGTPVPSIVI